MPGGSRLPGRLKGLLDVSPITLIFTLLIAGAVLITACGDGTPSADVTATRPLSVSPSPTPTVLPPALATATRVPTATLAPATSTRVPTATLTPAVSDEIQARQLRVFTKLWETVRDSYVYPDFNGLDWDEVYRRYRARVEMGLEDEDFYQAMREMIDELGDEHSAFNSPQEVAEEEERVRGQLDYVGIGIYVTTLYDKGYAVLLQVFPDSPAARVGLSSHDRILAVDGTPVIDVYGGDHLDRLQGPAGSEVQLTAQTPGQDPRQLVVTRARIQTQLPVDAYRLPGTDVGYVMIPTLWDQTVADRLRQALEGLVAAGELEGLIVDMRINGGGLDTMLRDALAIFTGGELGSFVGRDAERPLVIEAAPVGNSQELPLAVLVGRETESFGEIFSGLLRESRGALVVGRTTDGNVETLWRVDFEDGSRAWIASETFRPPSGADWERGGIVPDIEIPLDWDEFTAEDDPQMQAALEWLLQAVGN
jgi:carboxyl-terminal processing protease